MDKYANQAADCAAQSASYTVSNNRSTALSWAQSFLSTQYTPEPATVQDLIATARVIEAYLDGGSAA